MRAEDRRHLTVARTRPPGKVDSTPAESSGTVLQGGKEAVIVYRGCQPYSDNHEVKMSSEVDNGRTAELADLHRAIDEIDRIGDARWMADLNERKRQELQFHDAHRGVSPEEVPSDTFEELYGNKKYYGVVRRSNDYIIDWLEREAKDRVFLDYACGDGHNTMAASEAGAALSLGFDISSVSVLNARQQAERLGLSDIRFFQADAEDTKLPDNSIDRIVCSGMLHHLDLSYALPEMRRILKPGGKVLAIEALDYNPLIKWYRRRTPGMRTDWEKAHILSVGDVRFAERFFELTNIHYWHVVGYAAGKFPRLSSFLERVDPALERVPGLNRMAWIFTFELTKPRSD